MNAKWTLLGLCLFTAAILLAGLTLASHKSPPQPSAVRTRALEVNGVIRSMEADGKTVVIEHEDIPDFMPAMTMPFTVRDPGLLRGLQAGDRVRFQLVVTKDDSWISGITRAVSTGLPASYSSGSSDSGSADPLRSGQLVPDFTLTDQNGRAFQLQDFRGKAVLLTFIYTRCPLPNYCPLMSKNFASLQERLSKEFAGQFHLITVTFDPEHDTPEVLKQYGRLFTRDDSTWSFGTGSPGQIKAVAEQFGLVYLPESGSFTHDLRTALIAPDGRLVHVWRSNVWTPYEVQRRVAEVLQKNSVTYVSTGGARPRSSAHE